MNVPMIDSFMKALIGPCRVERGQSVLACCSGGVDSMVLLDLLLQVSAPLGIRVGVLHADHGIRKEASRADALTVSRLCQRLGVPCHVYELNLSRGGPNLEEQARVLRYARIAECMSAHGYDAAATGHSLDDQSETIIYRLVRGSGIRGMGGMEHRDPRGIVRPMLGFTRAEIEEYARSKGIAYSEDSTNQDVTLARNLIRREIIPLMRKINPSVSASIARFGDIARDEGRLVEDLSLALEQEALETDWGVVRSFHLEPLFRAPLAVLKRLVIRVASTLVREPRGIDASQVEEIVRVVNGSKASHTLMRRVTVARDGDSLAFFPAGSGPFYHTVIRGPGLYAVAPLNVSVKVDFRGKPPASMVLTSHAKGERFQGKRVVKLLADRGVMKTLRPFWPVVIAGGEVVSVAGVCDESKTMRLTTEFPVRGTGAEG